MVHDGLPFQRRTKLLEVGCGVGAQTEILLRHLPDIHVTGVEINDEQLAEARRFLADRAVGQRPLSSLAKGDATQLEYDAGSFDSAFLCWVLEHVGDPARVLSEVRRVLVPGQPDRVQRGPERDVLHRSVQPGHAALLDGVQRAPARDRRRSVRRREARQPAASRVGFRDV